MTQTKRSPENPGRFTFLLAMALTGEADYLVTGVRRAWLLQRGNIGRTRIVIPATFCAEAL